MPSTRFRGCGRGIFGLASWNYPLRRPACLQQANTDSKEMLPGQTLMMKYTFKANPDSPLGKELPMKPKALMTYVSRYDEHWIMVRNEDGEEGYVPTSYVTVTSDSDTVTSLPWLDQKASEDNVKQQAAEYKPYQSAYAPKTKENNDSSANLKEYYCKICEKQLNGPIPYSSHLVSKAHKEEVQAAADYA